MCGAFDLGLVREGLSEAGGVPSGPARRSEPVNALRRMLSMQSRAFDGGRHQTRIKRHARRVKQVRKR